jgi:hypothetical protein
MRNSRLRRKDEAEVLDLRASSVQLQIAFVHYIPSSGSSSGGGQGSASTKKNCTKISLNIYLGKLNVATATDDGRKIHIESHNNIIFKLNIIPIYIIKRLITSKPSF